MYLDYAASAPLHPLVRDRLQQLLQTEAGNASSLHAHGRRARMELERSREEVAGFLGARVEEIVFTSGATEANNLALLGWMRQQPAGAHMLISAVEHPSVWEAAEMLAYEGYRWDPLEVDGSGIVDLERLKAKLRPETTLVSVMAVNNEVGSLQPVAELARRDRPWKLHVDAVQSAWVGWPALQGIDFLTLSAHKMGGPVGSGCLFLRQGLRLQPLMVGGAQEDHRRAGTSNVWAAVGLAAAMEWVAREGRREGLRLRVLQQQLEMALGQVEGATRLGGPCSPHLSSWIFEGVTAESLLVLLDMHGISASSGSACSSHSLEPSRVLLAMGYSPQQARGLVRFSLGFATTSEEISALGQVVPGLVDQIRQRSLSSR